MTKKGRFNLNNCLMQESINLEHQLVVFKFPSLVGMNSVYYSVLNLIDQVKLDCNICWGP